MNTTYEVVLGPAAIQAIRNLRNLADRSRLANALRQELSDGPNAANELRFDCEGKPQVEPIIAVPNCVIYTATPLSFRAYTAVHRAMTEAELLRLSREQDRAVAHLGFLVFDLLRAELGFVRWQEVPFWLGQA